MACLLGSADKCIKINPLITFEKNLENNFEISGREVEAVEARAVQSGEVQQVPLTELHLR